MKILLVSDLHYALKQFDWTLARASCFDLVVVAGDHIDIAGQLSGNVQVAVLLKYFKRIAERTKLIVSSGNHDLDARDANGEKVASWMKRVRQLGATTDGDTLDLVDATISVCRWWDGPLSRENVEAQLKRDSMQRKKRWFWVYHAPPEGSPTSWNGRRFFGDPDLKTWIERFTPDVVFTGHIHEAPFKAEGSWVDRIGTTWVFNSGRQIGPTPTCVVLDVDANEAAWFSLAGDEGVRLDAPLQRPVTALSAPPGWLIANPALGRSPA